MGANEEAAAVGLISTLGTNIGDDMVREGVLRMLRRVLARGVGRIEVVNKHRPLTVLPAFHPLRGIEVLIPNRFRRWTYERLELALRHMGETRFDSCDIVVQCGAPVVWPGCHKCEWAAPLWRHTIGRLHTRLPVLNIAAGSCYPWERQPETIEDAEESAYVREMVGHCRLTTARDVLARKLLEQAGGKVPLLPCSALLAATPEGPSLECPEVLINYMAGGGHYGWDQEIDIGLWERIVRRVVEELKRNHTVGFLCHNREEVRLASSLDSSLPRLAPRTAEEFFVSTRRAKILLCNRLHAAVCLAGLGIPSVTVGTDTRLLMTRALGIPALYVKDVDAGCLLTALNDIWRRRTEEGERLLLLRRDAEEAYEFHLRKALEGTGLT
jgi:polysaccharide pyruvyl transferase WcaK-like protein